MNPQQIAAEHGIPVEQVRERWMQLRAAIWKADFRRFCRDVIRIRAKDADLVPLVLNEAQAFLLSAAEAQLKETGWVRLLGLKARRQGFSTLVAARGFWRATLWDRQHVYILSHEMKSSDALFDMVDLMQQKHPFPPAVGIDNANSLEFKHRGSSYAVATAGQKAGGRGRAISFMHGSEVAFWTNAKDHFAASVQAVDPVKGRWGVLWTKPARPLPFEAKMPAQIMGWVKPPSEIWLETTSSGPTGEFYERYQRAVKGEGDFRAVFVPWTVTKEYGSDYEDMADEFVPDPEPGESGVSEAEYQQLYNLSNAQMLWRRNKIIDVGSMSKMYQEYPIDDTEAFAYDENDAIFIRGDIILRARKRDMPDPDAPLIIGVDPAGAGGDRFAVAYRRGDKCLKIEHRKRLEHEDAVAWLCQIIDEHDPAKMVIDRGSMGANIISSLRARGPKYADVVMGIDFGGKSALKKAQPDKSGPWNRRAEIWGKMREWLLEDGVIPDDKDLGSDLSAPRIKYRANNDWLLESKTEMKARGVSSPDLADALAMTFAVTQFFDNWSKPAQPTGFHTGRAPVAETYVSSTAPVSRSPYGWMR